MFVLSHSAHYLRFMVDPRTTVQQVVDALDWPEHQASVIMPVAVSSDGHSLRTTTSVSLAIFAPYLPPVSRNILLPLLGVPRQESQTLLRGGVINSPLTSMCLPGYIGDGAGLCTIIQYAEEEEGKSWLAPNPCKMCVATGSHKAGPGCEGV